MYFGQFRYRVITKNPHGVFLVTNASVGSTNFTKSHRMYLQALIWRDETEELRSETGITEKKHIHVAFMRQIF